jgi:chromosome segregation ATPase
MAQTSLMYLEADKERLTKELQLCQERHNQSKSQLADSERERNQFELAAAKSERELAVVQEERSVLQVRAPFTSVEPI